MAGVAPLLLPGFMITTKERACSLESVQQQNTIPCAEAPGDNVPFINVLKF